MSATHTSREYESKGLEDANRRSRPMSRAKACLGLGILGAYGLDGDGGHGCRRGTPPPHPDEHL